MKKGYRCKRVSCLVNKRVNYYSETQMESGVALLMVLWVMVFLGVVTAEFARSMRTEISIARNYKEDIEAQALANSGLAMAFSEILNDYRYNTRDPESGETMFIRKKDEEEKSLVPVKREEVLETGSYSYSITDEESRININNMSRDVLIRLLSKGDVEEGTLRATIVDSILDWLDSNDLHRINGAEESYYMSLKKPYHCKNGNFSKIDELLLVKGMTRDILYGGGDYSGIFKLLTVAGKGKTNLNTSSEEVLQIMQGDIEAAKILAARKLNDGIYDKTQKSFNFNISATGAVSSVTHTINVLCRKSIKNKLPSLAILSWNEIL